MIVLSQSADTLMVVLGGAITTNQLRCVSAYRDITSTTYTAGRARAVTNNTTDVSWITGPTSGQRVIDFLSVFNKDTVSATVTVKLDTSGTQDELWKGALATGERLEYTEGHGFRTFTISGAIKTDVGGGGTVSAYAVSNTTQSTSGTYSNVLSFHGAGIASVGVSNGSVVISVPAGGGAGDGGNVLAAGTQTATTLGTVLFADSNGLTFGMSGSTQITGSYSQSTHSHATAAYSGSNGSFTANTVTFGNLNGLTFYTSNGSMVGSHNALTTAAASGHSHGDPTLNLTNLSGTTASNSAGFTLSLSAANPGAGGGMGISAGTQSVSTGTMIFADSNGVTFGMSGSSQITASYSQSTHSHATAAYSGSNGSFTANTVTFGSSNGMHFYTTNGSIVGSYTVPAAQTNVAFSADASSTFQTLTFQNSNNVSFSNNAGAIRITHNLAGTSTGSAGANVGISMTHNSSGLNLSITTPATVAQTNQTLSLAATSNTTGNTSGMSVDARSITLRGDGIVSVGYSTSAGGSSIIFSATQSNQAVSNSAGSFTFQTLNFSNANNVTFGTSAGGIITASVAAGGGAAISAGANSQNTGTVNFANSNNVTFGLSNNGTMTASIALAASNSAGSFTFGTLNFSNANNVTFGTSAGGIITASVAAPGAAAENNWFALLGANTAGNTTASGSTIGLSGVGVTLSGTNGSVIVVSGNSPPQISRWQNIMNGPGRTDSALNWQQLGTSQSSLYIMPLDMDGGVWQGNMTASTVFVNMSGSISGAASTAAKTLSMFLGIYTENASSLSLLNSVSASVGSNAAAANMTASFNGPRLFSAVSSAWSSTPAFVDGSIYYIGYMMQSAGESFALSWRGLYGVSGQQSGTMGSSIAATNTTMKSSPWRGVYTAQTAALPTVISGAHLRGTGSAELFVPVIMFENRLSSF